LLSPFSADVVDPEVNAFGTAISTRHSDGLHLFARRADARFSSYSNPTSWNMT
jgi:hypothetical protein